MTTWHKSSYSGSVGISDCVEVADLSIAVGIRDSKASEAGYLALSRSGFTALVARIKQGEMER